VRSRLTAGLAAALLSLAVPAAASAACPDLSAYPGDSAAKADVAIWMAFGAGGRGVPRELPVMAALVESGIQNLPAGDADAAGYFQMRTSVWNGGAYAGFPENPPLQLRWFLDQATAVRQQRIAAGDLAYGLDESRWGEWVADVERPAEQYRGRYQLRLAEARGLVGLPCVDVVAPLEDEAPPPDPALDVTPPALSVVRALGTKALARTLAVPVRCPAESCVVWANGSVAVPSAARSYRISAPRRTLADGDRGEVRLALGRKLRKAASRALADGRRVNGSVTVHAVDPSGNETSVRRAFKLRRR
jgi:hypothetical protein